MHCADGQVDASPRSFASYLILAVPSTLLQLFVPYSLSFPFPFFFFALNYFHYRFIDFFYFMLVHSNI